MKRKAVLSIEAAICIPLFFIASMFLISIMSVVYINERIEVAICEEAKELSYSCYNEDTYGIHTVETKINDRLGYEILNHPLIKNRPAGLDYSDSDLSNPEVIKIAVKYTISFPFNIIDSPDFTLEKSIVTHTWVGYINGINSLSGLADYVYITKNGNVYHRDRECSHVRLSIRSIKGSELADVRNSSGGKYKKCEYCHPKDTDIRFYISEDGDRYHRSLSCSGLKRTVYRVRLSEVGNKRPCMRCGY